MIIVAGQAYFRLTPPVYQATSLVSLHRWTKETEGMNSAEEKLAAEECPVVTSLDNLHRLVQDPELRKLWSARDPLGAAVNDAVAVTTIRRRLTVRARPKSLSIEIRVVSDNRDEPAKVANTLAAIYTDYRSNQVSDLNSARVAVYGRESEEQGKKIAAAKSRLDQLYIEIQRERATNQNVYYDQEAYDALLNSRVELESVLGAKQRQLSEYQVMNSNDLIQVLSTTETNELLNGLLVEASHAKTALATVSLDHGADSPEVKRAEAVLVQLDSNIIHQVQVVMARKQAEVESTKSALANIDAKLKKGTTNTLEPLAHYAKYQLATNELSQLENAQSYLAKLATDSMRANVEPFILNYIPTIIQPAENPASPFVPDPKIGKMSLFGGAAAILLGVLIQMVQRTKKIPAAAGQKTK